MTQERMQHSNQDISLLPALMARPVARIPARRLLLAQFFATLLILALVPTNAAKLALMLVVWAVGFRHLTRRELLAFFGINLLFFGMNLGALKAGIFAFTHPDFLGMPVYEFGMWGFYALHLMRFVGGAPAAGRLRRPVCMAFILALPFMVGAVPLFPISAGLFLVVLLLFHERDDLRYAAYMLFMGALVEYIGTRTGQWTYSNPPLGGVPFWFIPMWAGVGLFTRRLILPLLGPKTP